MTARLHENLRDSARLTGNLQRGPLLSIQQTNIMANPDVARAIARLVAAVAPCSCCRPKVVAALHELDAQSGALTIDHDG